MKYINSILVINTNDISISHSQLFINFSEAYMIFVYLFRTTTTQTDTKLNTL